MKKVITSGSHARIMATGYTFDYAITRCFLETHAKYVSGRCG
jgi:hypothetical protein